MPIYEYKCRACRTSVTVMCPPDRRDEPLSWSCPNCEGETLKRRFHLNVGSAPIPAYVDSHGNLIDSAKAAARVAQARSDELAAKGIIQPVGDIIDPRDLAANPEMFGVTDEGLDTTHNRAVAEGTRESKGRFVFELGERG